MTYRDTSLAMLKVFEGEIPWMYRDASKSGYCTCATGNLLPNVDAAIALPWQIPSGMFATADQIAQEYQRVMAMPAGLLALHYRIPGSLLLAVPYMDQLLSQRVDGFEAQLREIYPDYDAQPDGAKTAEIDLIFNLGKGGLLEYRQMNAALLVGHYADASVQCARRPPVSATRNLWTKNQLRLAAGLSTVAA